MKGEGSSVVDGVTLCRLATVGSKSFLECVQVIDTESDVHQAPDVDSRRQMAGTTAPWSLQTMCQSQNHSLSPLTSGCHRD